MSKIKIFLTKGSSEGVTAEAAYCQALKKAGIVNLNLISLSSVLPHNCEIVNKKPKFSYQDYGKRIYVIISEIRTSNVGETICAGLGWVQGKSTDCGLVVQSEGNNEERLKKEIKNSLKEIIRFRKEKYKKPKIVIEEITYKNKPVCALVALVFDRIEEWLGLENV